MNTPATRRSSTKPAQAFTVTELLIVLTCLAILAAVLLPALKRARSRGGHISCANNIKQVCLSSLLWSHDNNNHFPMQVPVADGGTLELVPRGLVYPHFLALSNELNTPRVLRCPEDERRPMALKFSDLTDTNVSYFLNVDAMAEVIEPNKGASVLLGDGNITNRAPAGSPLVPITKASTIAWTKNLHSEKGYVGFADGRSGLFINRKPGLARTVGTDGTALQLPDGVTNRLAVPLGHSRPMLPKYIVSILRAGTPQFVFASLATLVVTIRMCRRRIARNKQMFFINTLASTVIVNAILLVAMLLLGAHSRGNIFASRASMASAVFWGLLFAGLSIFVSILPALGVACYYDRRSRKNEAHTA